MNSRLLLILLLVAIGIWGISGFAAVPLLFAPEKDPSVSFFHENPAVLPQGSTNSTEEIVWRMQDIMDTQELIIVGLNTRDTGGLARNISYYNSVIARLRSTTGQLGINGGEMRAFITRTSDQGAILKELANQSAVMDALAASAERAGNNPDLLATIASQEAAIREKRNALIVNYTDDHAAVVKVASEVGLDTTRYKQALFELRKYFNESENAPVIIPPGVPPVADDVRITLLLDPATAAYGDPVQVFGLALPKKPGRYITIRLDGAPVLNATTDSAGNYLSRFTVGRIPSGTHTLTAVSADGVSAGQALFIGTTTTSTTLTAEPGYYNWSETGAYVTGTVMAATPVTDAPVTLFTDGQMAINTTTNENGTFRAFVALPGGGHTITGQFSAEGYPLSPSVSAPVTVTVPGTPIRLLDILGAAALILVVIGGILFWLIRHPSRAAAEPEPEDFLDGLITDAEPHVICGQTDLPPEIGTLFARYQAILKAQGLSEAARKAYLDLASRIAVHLRLPAYRTLTPRELSGACTRKSYAGIVDIFVDSYERIRYGGSMKRQDQTGFEQELKAADTETGRRQL